MTDAEYELAAKWSKVNQMVIDPKTNFPPMLMQFFDFNSDKLLDEKIAVLTEMQKGTSYSDIPNFYDILELWSEKDLDGTVHWD